MCGIAGLVTADPNPIPSPHLLNRMGNAIAYRGPDGSGVWTSGGIGLVHRRLSIIDLTGGKQPLSNEDESVQVIFNGEIYNYRELRRELIARGHCFRTESDTEVLVHLYEDLGPEMLHRLRGMFALAIWDSKQHSLFLARDRLGLKPLCLFRTPKKVVFASQPGAFLHDPDFRSELDPAALDCYLTYGMVLTPYSIHRGVEKLLPGHSLVLKRNHLDAKPVRYWEPKFEAIERSTESWKEQIRAKIDETVEKHLIADVPVGALLSGGLDSSIIVSTAARFTSRPLHTFSIGFEDVRFCERRHAKEVASRFGTIHHEAVIRPDAVKLLDEIAPFFNEPFADCSSIPMYLVSKLARETVKVVLSGDGGDEAFGGYPRYAHDLREAKIRRCLPPWFRERLLGPLAKLWPQTDWLPRILRLKNTLTNLRLDPAEAYANSLAYCRMPLRRKLLAPEIRSQLNGDSVGDPIVKGYRTASDQDPVAGMIAADLNGFLPDDYLVKVDRASMAVGVEVRPPFLDHELIELASTIPSDLKICQGTEKWILKETYRDRLPLNSWDRPKQGFVMPIDNWFRGPLRSSFHDRVLSPRSPLSELIHLPTAAKLLEQHERGQCRHGQILWSLLVLATWSERYLSRPATTHL